MTTTYSNPAPDYVRRSIKRELPCTLTDEETLEIARRKSERELEMSELEADLADEKKRRQSLIDIVEKDILKMGREIRSGEQDRPVLVDEVFEDGMVLAVRRDTGLVVEKRPPTMQEAQRHLPAASDVLGGGGILERATAKQAAEDDGLADAPDDEPEANADGAPAAKGKKRGSKGKAK